jgi:hypothetical protein
MIAKLIEATNGPQNWGKFCVMRFDAEFSHESRVDPRVLLLRSRGWGCEHVIVFDLETREGAAFRPGGLPSADLNKHKIWVCPLFEPFLAWLYQQDLADLTKLPDHVDLPDAEFQWQGYRREGKA